LIVAREVSRTSIASRSVDAESSSLDMLIRLVLSVTSRIAPTLALLTGITLSRAEGRVLVDALQR